MFFTGILTAVHSLSVALEPEGKRLSRAEFQGLGDMPPELEWFANLDNPRTRRAYRNDVTSENDSDEIPVRVFLDRVSRYTDSSQLCPWDAADVGLLLQ